MSKVQPVETAISDYTLGKKMFYAGVDFDACTTDEMRKGWNRAENFSAWGVFKDQPQEAVSFESAQPWNAASAGVYPGQAIYPKTNSGYDYESRKTPREQAVAIQ
jgi:hypothetical protein